MKEESPKGCFLGVLSRVKPPLLQQPVELLVDEGMFVSLDPG